MFMAEPTSGAASGLVGKRGEQRLALLLADAGVNDAQTDERCVKCHTTAYGVSEEMRSTRFSHDALVGVKCSLKRACFSSQALISGVL